MRELLAGAPSSVRRLLAHYDAAAAGGDARAFLIGRLLEEGEETDLRWLVRQAGEQALKAWMATAGARQLSRRSLAFWSTVLGLETPTNEEDPLWLL